MRIYVKTVHGDTHIADVNSAADAVHIRRHLEGVGVRIPESVPIIISLRAFKQEFADASFPPIPKPQNADDDPPQTSEVVVVAANSNESLNVLFDNSAYMSLAELHGLNFVPAVPTYTLAYRRYWNQVTLQRIEGPQTFSFSAQTSEGMSETDTESWSAELGVAVNGLTAKLSDTFSQSFTVSSSTTVTHTYEISVPSGSLGVWVLWQLVDEVIALDAAGQQIQYSGEVTGFFAPHTVSIPSSRATQDTPTYDADITLFVQQPNREPRSWSVRCS